MATRESKTKEMVDELRAHASVLSGPTITKSVFNKAVHVAVPEEEQQIMLKAEEGRPVYGFTISYGDDEVYQVFVLGGHYT